MDESEQEIVPASVLGPADVDWPAESLARLAFSQAARDLAESAAGLVPTVDRHERGELVEAAARLVESAAYVLRRAVVAERAAGVTWDEVGEALGVTRQSAHERYAGDVREWEAVLDEPYTRGPGGIWNSNLPEGADEPDRWVVWLDRWCTFHATRPGNEHSEHLVSAGLARHTDLSRTTALLREARWMVERARAGRPPSRQREASYRARKQDAVAAAEATAAGGTGSEDRGEL